MSQDSFKVKKSLLVTPVTSRPSSPSNGEIIYNTTNGSFEQYTNGAWVTTIDYSVLNKELTGRDSNGIFTTVEYKVGSSLRKRSVLSGGTSPTYTTRTVTLYAADGTTVISTTVYTLAYDGNGDLISETV